MNEQEILNSLAALEQTLQGIDSARKQVQNVASAYDAVKNQFSVLNNDISTISKDLKSIFETIKENNSTVSTSLNSKMSDTFTAIDSKIKYLGDTSTKINEDFAAVCNTATSKLSSDVDTSIGKINDCVVTSISQFKEKTNNEIAKISTIIASLESASTNISNEFKMKVETILANNRSAQSLLVSNTKTEIRNQLSYLEQFKKDLKTILKNYNQLYSQIKQDSDLAFDEIRTILSNVQDSISDVADIIKKADKANSASFNNINKKMDVITAQLTQQKAANDMIAKQQKDEISSVKKQQKKTQTMIVIGLILLAISLLINIIMITR